jgi:hypothetical protein
MIFEDAADYRTVAAYLAESCALYADHGLHGNGMEAQAVDRPDPLLRRHSRCPETLHDAGRYCIVPVVGGGEVVNETPSECPSNSCSASSLPPLYVVHHKVSANHGWLTRPVFHARSAGFAVQSVELLCLGWRSCPAVELQDNCAIP